MDFIFISDVAVLGQRHETLHLRLILEEQLVHNLILVTKVVVQVAGADIEIGRNVIGGHIAFALFVEQFEAG